MRVFAFLVGTVIGLGVPMFLFGLMICVLSLIDVFRG